MHTTTKFIVVTFALAILPILAKAQTSYHVGAKPEMTLYGTSTLHDWTMTAHAFTATAQFTVTTDNQLTAISSLTVDVTVHNLKSDHSGMDDNAYEALKADHFKTIVFHLTSASVTSSGGNKYQIAAAGNLTIAGVTHAETLHATGVVNADGSISVSGSVPIKLSDFNIERPSFMLGTMKVGDAMTLNYSLIFVK
ncbi:MAG TPA: YceI family protein [Candidatus Kapabacteria bacterium]|nr:YceI family protein [Candidatus Kapabacteria bacterium]